MKLSVDRKEPTLAILTIEATAEELSQVKNKTLRTLRPRVNVAGFRKGKVPLEVVEKNVDQ